MLWPVPTPLRAELDFPADPVRAYALVTDETYVVAVAEATGGQDIEVTVEDRDGGAVVTSRRSLPAELPSYAKALVGDTLRLTEVRTYGPAAADGSRTGAVSVDFDGAPVRIEGTLSLAPSTTSATGSICAMEAAVRASVPFVGGKVERFAAEQVQAFLAKETEVAIARLG
jgi:hypothetical protein